MSPPCPAKACILVQERPSCRRSPACFTLDLPGLDELKAIAQRVVADLSRERPIRIDLTPAGLRPARRANAGLHRARGRARHHQDVLRDGALWGNGLEAMVEIKKELLQKEGPPRVHRARREPGRGRLDSATSRRGSPSASAPLRRRRRGSGSPRPGAFCCSACRAPARRWSPAPSPASGSYRSSRWRRGEALRQVHRRVGEEPRQGPAHGRADGPCVLMIDELEKSLSYSPVGDSDAGLSKRIFGRTPRLAPGPGTAPVFVVATSNNIAELPPELTRKGRFDEIFFVDLPGVEDRKDILGDSPAQAQALIPPRSTSIGWLPVRGLHRRRDPAGHHLRALHGVLALGRAQHRHRPRRAEVDQAAIGDPAGGDRRPPRVGPRARGDRELNGRRLCDACGREGIAERSGAVRGDPQRPPPGAGLAVAELCHVLSVPPGLRDHPAVREAWRTGAGLGLRQWPLLVLPRPGGRPQRRVLVRGSSTLARWRKAIRASTWRPERAREAPLRRRRLRPRVQRGRARARARIRRRRARLDPRARARTQARRPLPVLPSAQPLRVGRECSARS